MSSTAGLSLDYNSLNQATTINGVSMRNADVTQDERSQAGSNDFSYTPLGLSAQDAGTDTYFTRDNPGSAHRHTDANGDQVGQLYEYEPYGKQIAGQTQVDNPWHFASGYHDNATGLLKFGTHYNDPDTMRWTQPDPVAGTLSKSHYA